METQIHLSRRVIDLLRVNPSENPIRDSHRLLSVSSLRQCLVERGLVRESDLATLIVHNIGLQEAINEMSQSIIYGEDLNRYR